MIAPDEIRRSFTAIWRLFLGRREALRDLDTSSDGFWRSFQVILLVAPLYLVASFADWQALSAIDSLTGEPMTGIAFGGEAFAASRVVTLALDWVTLPILLALLAGFLGIRQTYGAFVVARNWSVPVAVAPFAAIALLEMAGIATGDLVVILSLVAFAFSLRIAYMVARVALDAPMPIAIGYVVLDFLVSLAIARIVTMTFGVPMW